MDRVAYVKKLNAAQKFTRFSQLVDYITRLEEETKNFERQYITAILLYLKDTIKSKYGVHQTNWPDSKNPTPLYETGALRQAVRYKTTPTGGQVYLEGYHWGGLTNEQLGMIHEYGSGKIPPRPIWQVVTEKEFPQIEQLISDQLGLIF